MWLQCFFLIIRNKTKTVVFHLQGFPEFADDEIVSVPDAKYTKGEFEVGALSKQVQPLNILNNYSLCSFIPQIRV